MTTLVLGATGATGRLLVSELLHRGNEVRAIVRSPDRFPPRLKRESRLTLIQAGIVDLDRAELSACLSGCAAVASCLGHNLTFKGVYGRPRRLVTDAVRRVCQAIRKIGPDHPVRFVLMNTAGSRNRDLIEPVSLPHQAMLGLLRAFLPPFVDSEEAAEYLRSQVGLSDPAIEWAVVRPDTLIDENEVTEYLAHPSPTRSALFNPGKTSRINVAHFMAELICEDSAWSRWKGQMPVLYNRKSPQGPGDLVERL